MTDALASSLRALLDEWHTGAKQAKQNANNLDIAKLDQRQCLGVSQAYAQCAHDLEALLSAHEAPQPERAIGIPDVQALSTLAHEAATPAAELKRFTPGGEWWDQMVETPWGEWVRWEDVQHASAEAAPVERPEGWQPIETAPKDGREILAYGDLKHIDVIRWDDDEEPAWTDGEYTYSPTHWMPLPALPPSTERQP